MGLSPKKRWVFPSSASGVDNIVSFCSMVCKSAAFPASRSFCWRRLKAKRPPKRTIAPTDAPTAIPTRVLSSSSLAAAVGVFLASSLFPEPSPPVRPSKAEQSVVMGSKAMLSTRSKLSAREDDLSSTRFMAQIISVSSAPPADSTVINPAMR